MQIVDNRALLVQTPEPTTITTHVAKSKQTTPHSVVVHWGHSEAEALADLRLDETPSPILRDYKWTGRYQPFAHQRTTASFLSIRRRAFCFNEQGTGKTASVIWAADYLMNLGLVKRVLVLCPLSIMNAAWQKDLFSFAMHRSCGVAHGTPGQRQKVVASGVEFVIVNFDGLAVIEEDVLNGGFDLIVVDEANAYKNAQTRRWKILNRVLKALNPRLWMLTGTPAAQSPMDAYGLAKMVNPEGCPKYFGDYKASVMRKVTQFKWVPKPEATAKVHAILQPAIRFEKADCLDLPEVTYIDRDAPLTPMQRKYYAELKKELRVEAAGEAVSAVNAATKLNKLLQISGGAVYADTGQVLEFDVSNRLNVVSEVIAEASHKVLVFVPFTHTINLLKDHLEAQGYSVAVINGSVTPNERMRIVDRFQSQADPHVLILQPQAASHGLTLTAADTIIWYAPIPSVETYLQANARIDRAGQQNAMTIVRITGSPVEEHLYAMLGNHVADHTQLVDLYRAVLQDPT